MDWRDAAEALYGSCYCPGCHPEAFPVLEGMTVRQNEGHVSVRFGDQDGPMVYSVIVGGVDRSTQVFEALPGRDGWAWLFSMNTEGKKHRCPCGAEPCQQIITGLVEVRGEPRAADAGRR